LELFDNENKNKGFSADVARQLVEIHEKHYPDISYSMYPFNHIRAAAQFGRTFITKPTNGLIVEDANRLKELGYDVNYDIKTETWTISWK
jgi:hypothetical protein